MTNEAQVVYSTIFSSFIGKKTNLRSYTFTLTALFLSTLLWHNTNRSDLWPLILLPQPFKHWTHSYTVTNDFIFIGHSHLFPLMYYLCSALIDHVRDLHMQTIASFLDVLDWQNMQSWGKRSNAVSSMQSSSLLFSFTLFFSLPIYFFHDFTSFKQHTFRLSNTFQIYSYCIRISSLPQVDVIIIGMV